jgi:hypothetical protein
VQQSILSASACKLSRNARKHRQLSPTVEGLEQQRDILYLVIESHAYLPIVKNLV